MLAKGKITERLWSEIQPIYKEILNHPFVNQLAEGTLPLHCFAHYLAQDILYISEDSKALELLSKRTANPEEKQFFTVLAMDGLEIERSLHDDYLKHFGLSKAKRKSPVCRQYTEFLLYHSGNSPYPVAAAALLPCFWVYNKTGEHIVTKCKENNFYQKWIDTYAGEEYDRYTHYFIQLVEDMAAKADQDTKEQMLEAFVQSTKYELQFFEEAFHVNQNI